MKDVYIYNDALDDIALNQLAQLEEAERKSFDEPTYKRVKLNAWDLNTLVYILEMDISHEEKWSREHPNEEPVKRVIARERELLNKIKGIMED